MKELFSVFEEGDFIRVTNDTWGHLKPKPNSYKGYIIFIHTEYNHLLSLVSDFENIAGSPWFFQAQNDFIEKQKTDAGMMYIFEGEYIVNDNEDVGSFYGEIRTFDPVQLLKKSS